MSKSKSYFQVFIKISWLVVFYKGQLNVAHVFCNSVDFICFLLYKRWILKLVQLVDVCAYRASAASRHTASLKRGKVSACLPVPDHIQKPHYVISTLLPEISSEYQIHNAEGIARMRAACKLASQVLDYAGTLVRVSSIKF